MFPIARMATDRLNPVHAPGRFVYLLAESCGSNILPETLSSSYATALVAAEKMTVGPVACEKFKALIIGCKSVTRFAQHYQGNHENTFPRARAVRYVAIDQWGPEASRIDERSSSLSSL